MIKGFCSSGFELAKNLFEFGPGLFDGVQIGRVRRKVKQLCLALFDALASAEKTLHANPGRHGEIPAFELDSSLRFFARHLG